MQQRSSSSSHSDVPSEGSFQFPYFLPPLSAWSAQEQKPDSMTGRYRHRGRSSDEEERSFHISSDAHRIEDRHEAHRHQDPQERRSSDQHEDDSHRSPLRKRLEVPFQSRGACPPVNPSVESWPNGRLLLHRHLSDNPNTRTSSSSFLGVDDSLHSQHAQSYDHNSIHSPSILACLTHASLSPCRVLGVTEEHPSIQFQGKAKFREAQPTLVLKKDFEIVHKALTLQQQRSDDDLLTSDHHPLLSSSLPEDTTRSEDFSQDQLPATVATTAAVVDSQDRVSTAELGPHTIHLPSDTTASVTSDFIAWLDTPLASAPMTIPPQLTFSKDEKGQPVTVIFYHDQEAQHKSNDTLLEQPHQDDHSREPELSSDNDSYREDTPQQRATTTPPPTTVHQERPVLQAPPLLPSHRQSQQRSFSSCSLTSPSASSDVVGPESSLSSEGSATPRVPTSKVTLKFSAGVCLLRNRVEKGQVIPEVLVIRRSSEPFYELPKGHLEKGESLKQAASRELMEETGITSPIEIGSPLLSERYVVKKSASERLEKSVHYFRARLMTNDFESETQDVLFGEREKKTRELRWMQLEEAKKAFWKSSAVRSVVIMSLTLSEQE